MEIEYRAASEIRAAGRRLQGYAATYGTPARIGPFTEVILPGAFSSTLASGRDVRCLVDHDETKLLGRTSAGTLTLRSDAKGLAFDLVVPSTTLGSDILALVERRDVQSLSFGFQVPAGGDRWPTATSRELRSVDLSEISILHGSPAYGSTSIEARHRAVNDAAAQRRLYLLGMI